MKKLLILIVGLLAAAAGELKAQTEETFKPGINLVYDFAKTKKWRIYTDTDNILRFTPTGGTPTVMFTSMTGTGTRLATLSSTGVFGSLANGSDGQFLSISGGALTFVPSPVPSGAALTRSSDTNVTLTLGGTPTTALLQATSLTVGWSGTLATSRGGLGGSWGSTVADRFPYTTSTGVFSEGTLTSFGRSLMDDAAASNGRTTLGLGTISIQDADNVAITGGTITGITGTFDVTNTSAGLTTLGLQVKNADNTTSSGTRLSLVGSSTNARASYLESINMGANNPQEFLISTSEASSAPDEKFRILQGGQIKLTKYVGTGSFTGTTTGFITFNSTGGLLTKSASGFRNDLGVGTGDSPSFTGLTVSGLTSNRIVSSGTIGTLEAGGLTSAQVRASVTDETGTAGGLVFADSPTLITPILGVADATTLNTGQGDNELFDMDQNVMTTSTPSFTGLTVSGLTSNRIVSSGTSGTLAAGGLTSAQASASITDETGSGLLVFGTNPTITTINLTGGQIAFPATQAVVGAANTLDDYEEGYWTPVYSASSGALGSITYTLQDGIYTKIGNTVYFTIRLSTAAFAVGTGSGAIRINLPFTTNNDGPWSFAVGISSGWGASGAGNHPTSALASDGTTTTALYYRSTSSGPHAALQCSDAQTGANANGNSLSVTGFYFTTE